MRNRIRLQLFLTSEPLESNSKQSKLFAPISEVVDSGDFPSVSFVEVGKESTDDGRSKVTGVEGFGDVGRGEFDCEHIVERYRRVSCGIL